MNIRNTTFYIILYLLFTIIGSFIALIFDSYIVISLSLAFALSILLQYGFPLFLLLFLVESITAILFTNEHSIFQLFQFFNISLIYILLVVLKIRPLKLYKREHIFAFVGVVSAVEIIFFLGSNYAAQEYKGLIRKSFLDAIFGFLILTPIFLFYLKETQNFLNKYLKQLIIPLFIVFIGYYWIGSVFQKFNAENRKLRFQNEVIQASNLLESNINTYLYVIQSLKTHFQSNTSIDRKTFKNITSSYLERFPGIQALEWVPFVPHNNRLEYRNKAISDGLSDFHIREKDASSNLIISREKEYYYPVYFVEPLEENRRALGYDLNSNIARQIAIEKAKQMS